MPTNARTSFTYGKMSFCQYCCRKKTHEDPAFLVTDQQLLCLGLEILVEPCFEIIIAQQSETSSCEIVNLTSSCRVFVLLPKPDFVLAFFCSTNINKRKVTPLTIVVCFRQLYNAAYKFRGCVRLFTNLLTLGAFCPSIHILLVFTSSSQSFSFPRKLVQHFNCIRFHCNFDDQEYIGSFTWYL